MSSAPSTRLSVNLNKLALLRNARTETPVDVLRYAEICLDAGAGGITVHPRPDARHIRRDDVAVLGGWLQGRPEEFNIEGNPLSPARAEAYPGLLELVRLYGCDQCTLVPDADQQSTSDHGWDLNADAENLQPVIAQLKQAGVRVSLFMDPDPDAMQRAADLGADCVELYTGPWVWARRSDAAVAARLLLGHAAAAEAAQAAGLAVHAGHDLSLDNLAEYLGAVRGVQEVSIGHALMLDALLMGLEQAVRRYIDCII